MKQGFCLSLFNNWQQNQINTEATKLLKRDISLCKMSLLVS